MAQEQLHSGLLRPDSVEAQGLAEARQVAGELADAPEVSPARAPVALIFDYDAEWAWKIQPHGVGLSYFELVFDTYRALRKAGLSVDILPPEAGQLEGYALIFAPGLMHMPAELKNALASSKDLVVLGPRSGARDGSMRIPVPLPPSMPGLDVTVSYVESLRPDSPVALKSGGAIRSYREFIETTADVLDVTDTGDAVTVAQGNLIYVAGWLDPEAMSHLVRTCCDRVGLPFQSLPGGVRCRDTGTERFWFNYDAVAHDFNGRKLPPASVTREELE